LDGLYEALVRHRGKCALFFIVAMGGAVLVTCLMARTYRSEAKLLVRLGRENATLDPTVMSPTDSSSVIPQSREDEINSIAELLHSRVLMEQVVDALGPAVILGTEARPAPVSASSESSVAAYAPPQSVRLVAAAGDVNFAAPAKRGASAADREKAIIALKKALDVTPVRKSNIISVSVESESPETAQAVVSKLVQSYLDDHARLNRNADAYTFLSEETARLREDLGRAEENLSDLKNQSGLTSAEGQRQILTAQIGRLEDDLSKSRAAASASRSKIAALSAAVAKAPAQEISGETVGVGNQGTELMRGQLYTLQLKEKELASKLTDAHPLLQEIRREVGEAKAILDREEPTRKHVTTAPSHSRQLLEAALDAERPVLAGLEAEATALQSQLADARDRMRTFNGAAVRIASSQREVELLEASYRRTAASLEQARIDQSQANERISNISLAQPASYEMKPIRPRVGTNLALGFMVSCLGAVGLALSAERFRRPAPAAESGDTMVVHAARVADPVSSTI
jgi:uncharacterized protein involved in exopolysaccharide biosynthesis